MKNRNIKNEVEKEKATEPKLKIIIKQKLKGSKKSLKSSTKISTKNQNIKFLKNRKKLKSDKAGGITDR